MKDKEKYIFNRDVQDALELIGGRWRGAIMASLCGSPKRFLDLKADLGAVTSRVLIRELRFLEQNRLIVVKEVRWQQIQCFMLIPNMAAVARLLSYNFATGQ